MSFQDLLKFATQEAVKQIDKPQTVRKAERVQKKADKEPITHWAFGMMPLAFSMMKRRLKTRRRR
jgi:hypothetical protein